MKICVFCSSSSRSIERYGHAAERLGGEIARRGHELVYGGSDMGLMKVVADSARSAGASIVGVIPAFMAREGIAANGLRQLWKVENMRERKETMERLADAFIVLPGGLGTLEELMEIASHRHMRLVGKPISLLNLNGFYDGLLEHLRRSIDEGFIFEELPSVLHVTQTPEEAVDHIEESFSPEIAESHSAASWRPREAQAPLAPAPVAPPLADPIPTRRRPQRRVRRAAR